MELTTRKFWSDYWHSKIEEFEKPVKSDYIFTPLFREMLSGKRFADACELGGFPGTFSIHVQRDLSLPCSLVDYFIDDALLQKFLKANNLAPDALAWKEADILMNEPAHQTFDFVFSIGLIEHFENTKEILQAHLKYMKAGGRLLIILPNFTGINGWFQRKFDRENYDKHFIPCMDPHALEKTLEELGGKQVQGGFLGNFSIWLENYATQPAWVKVFFKISWLAGKVLAKVLGLKGKTTAPYIWVACDVLG
ncbi:MAG: class I SAM-dependent methyltransferase [Bacteroidetes bacterium]|nr:class I SAM-dependent methyltransferase [Bacteroidota bacterium]